jgi:hypothetical protein
MIAAFGPRWTYVLAAALVAAGAAVALVLGRAAVSEPALAREQAA